jgi:hypothetical protein
MLCEVPAVQHAHACIFLGATGSAILATCRGFASCSNTLPLTSHSALPCRTPSLTSPLYRPQWLGWGEALVLGGAQVKGAGGLSCQLSLLIRLEQDLSEDE